MTSDPVTRARSALGKGILYVLGHGGWHPEDDLPTRTLTCDCTGYAAWLMGRCRQTGDPAFPWFETSAIVRDTLGDERYFRHIRWTDAQPGDFVVYGDRLDAQGIKHQGHIGMVTVADATGPLKVIHCSHGASVAQHDAITETGPQAWVARGVVARFHPAETA